MGRGTRTADTASATAGDIRAALRQRASDAAPSAAKVWDVQREAEEFSADWSQLMWDQKRLGGKVYRASDDRVDALRKRIDGMNKKAAKLGANPIELKITDEHTQEVVQTPTGERIADWTYVILGGSGPVVPGYVFVAALDHTVESGEKDPMVAIRRVPSFAVMHDLDENEVRRLAEVDYESFRHAENRCEHCGLKRKRNTTYLVFEKDTGRVVQVGSDCLCEFTGADSPEKVARWAEMLAALDSDMETEGTVVADEATRPAISTLDYLANATACARAHGWRKRWHDGERVDGTADEARYNMGSGAVPVTEADREVAEEALAWARDELPDRPNLSEFEQNMIAYALGDYLGQKGDGTLAYIPEAYRRERDKGKQAKAAAKSRYVGQPKERLRGLELKVQQTRYHDNGYGDGFWITRMADAEGNCFTWFASRELEAGGRYRLSGTVKRHEVDRYTQAQTTVLTNCRSIEEL